MHGKRGCSHFVEYPIYRRPGRIEKPFLAFQKNMRPKLDRFPMYVRYPNKSDTLKGILANMPPVKTCHSSPAGNGCYVGRFLMVAF